MSEPPGIIARRRYGRVWRHTGCRAPTLGAHFGAVQREQAPRAGARYAYGAIFDQIDVSRRFRVVPTSENNFSANNFCRTLAILVSVKAPLRLFLGGVNTSYPTGSSSLALETLSHNYKLELQCKKPDRAAQKLSTRLSRKHLIFVLNVCDVRRTCVTGLSFSNT